jgi:hypothetical protein
MTPSNPISRDAAQPSNFSAAAIAVLTASLCYARFTPAALHCGEIACACRHDAEAAGHKLEFRVSDFSRVIDERSDRRCVHSEWHQV